MSVSRLNKQICFDLRVAQMDCNIKEVLRCVGNFPGEIDVVVATVKQFQKLVEFLEAMQPDGEDVINETEPAMGLEGRDSQGLGLEHVHEDNRIGRGHFRANGSARDLQIYLGVELKHILRQNETCQVTNIPHRTVWESLFTKKCGKSVEAIFMWDARVKIDHIQSDKKCVLRQLF